MTYVEMMTVLGSTTYEGRRDFWEFRPIKIDDKKAYELLVSIRVIERHTEEEDKLWKRYVIFPDELKILTKSGLLRRVRDLLVQLQSHEVEEQILFNNKRIFDPHSEIA